MTQVHKTIPEIRQIKSRSKLTLEQFQCEADYLRSVIILQKALARGLITEEEYSKIDKINRQSFSPQLASIMA